MQDQLTLDELQSHLQQFYSQGNFRAALDLASDSFELFPEQALLLRYWQITMSARLGENEQALRFFRLVLEDGGWYGEVLLRYSPSFGALQGIADFETLVQLNRERQEADQEHIFPMLVLHSEGRCQSKDAPCPLLLALHANASTAQASLNFWRAAASAGWLVAAPQSSQPIWKNAYVWDDREYAQEEITRLYHLLHRQYAVDHQNMVLAGHSMGGEMAIWLSMQGGIAVRGFIAIGPGGPFMDALENWETAIQSAGSLSLRGYLIVGLEDDSIPKENIHKLAVRLNNAGIPCLVEEIPDVGHDFSVEYEASLLRALDFIFQKNEPSIGQEPG